MKKSLILPFSLAALMMISGCSFTVAGENTVDQTPSTSQAAEHSEASGETAGKSNPEGPAKDAESNYSVTISNKEDLQAAFFIGDNLRTITVTADPEIDDINDAIDDGLISFSSSNPEVAKVTRNKVEPVTAGKATLSVTYGDATDSVEIEVRSERTAIEKYGTVHAGTAEDPLDNHDACIVATACGSSEKSPEYYITGEVASWYHFPGENSAYTSWFFKAKDGDSMFECYKIAYEDGTGVTLDDVFPGAVVTVKGKITVYSGQPETDTGVFVEKISGTTPEMKTVTDESIDEIIRTAKVGYDGHVSYDLHKVTGYVQKVSGSNYFIGDTQLGEGEKAVENNLLEIYAYDVSSKGVAEGSVEDTIKYGAKVEFTAHIKRYHNQIEAVLLEGAVKVVEKGIVVENKKATVTEALSIGAALADNGTTDEAYDITGYVCKKGTYSDSYGYGDIYIAESAEETDTTKMLDVFRIADKDKFNSFVVGDKIMVSSALTKYVKSGKTPVIETSANPTVAFVLINRTFAETYAIGQTLESGEVTTYEVSFDAYIVDLGTWSSYGNVDLKVAAEEGGETTITIYRFTDKDTYDTLAVGDFVNVTSAMTRFKNASKDVIETNAKVATIVKKDKPAASKDATVAQALEDLALLDDNTNSEITYNVTGYVVKKDDYVNAKGSFYIADSADETASANMIQAYNITDKTTFDEVTIGDKVIITGPLCRYANAKKTYIQNEVVAPTIKYLLMNRSFETVYEIGQGLAHQGTTSFDVCFGAYIADLGTWSSYGNADLTVVAEVGDETTMTVYRFSDKDTYDTLAVGDYVKVTGPLTRYNDIIETVAKKATIVKAEAPKKRTIIDGVAGETKTYTFADATSFASWSSSYTEHTVLSEEMDETLPSVTFAFSKHDKQAEGQTIDDCPVSKAGNLTVTIDGKVGAKGIKVNFKQWNSKTQKVSIVSGETTLVAETAVDFATGVTYSGDTPYTTFTINAVQSNQIGWVSVELTF